MRAIETNNQITIKKAIEKTPNIGELLRFNGPLLPNGIRLLSEKTGLPINYLEQNLKQIRNWI